MTTQSFRELEHAGWLERASSYDFITPVTDQAIEPILATFAKLDGLQLLEVASGPGHLSAQAASRGAAVEAVDFAITMVERAQAQFPKVRFVEGDAEQLTQPSDSFDGVICAFGLLHLAQPERAVSEAFRVLKSGGRYTYTVWCTPEEGGEFFSFLMGAIAEFGDLNVPMPEAPSFYRFADPDESAAVLAAAGFTSITRTTVPIFWRGTDAQDAVDVIYKATVRTKALLDAQQPAAREAIHKAIVEGVEQFRTGEQFEIALPAVMMSSLKPS